jgi:branched-chain amino acid transport system substrate-binding protein
VVIAAATALVVGAAGVMALVSNDGSGLEPGPPSPSPSGPGVSVDAEPLQFAYLLPETGALAYLGEPMIAAVEMAVDDINTWGGVLGHDLPGVLRGDESDDTFQAGEAAGELVGDGAHAVIGPAASGMTQATYGLITGAEVVQCSGSNGALELSDLDDGGFYFRTMPSDALSARAMAQVIVDAGEDEIAVVQRDDDYGEVYAEHLVDELESLGAEVVTLERYAPEEIRFDEVVDAVEDSGAEAVAVISFDEGAGILAGLLEERDGDEIYVTDGVLFDDLGVTVDSDDPDVVDDITAVRPGARNDDFDDALTELGIDSGQFAAHVYDCVTTVALAAEAAGSTNPADIAAEMQGVTRDGEVCEFFEQCRDLLHEGEDIDYHGMSGPIRWDDNGDATAAMFEVVEFDDDELTVADQILYDPED